MSTVAQFEISIRVSVNRDEVVNGVNSFNFSAYMLGIRWKSQEGNVSKDEFYTESVLYSLEEIQSLGFGTIIESQDLKSALRRNPPEDCDEIDSKS